MARKGNVASIDSSIIDPLFGWLPPDRSWVPSVRYLLRRERVLDLLASRPPGRLLEVGCGAGSLMVELATRGHRCTGLETSEAARRIARHSLDQSALQGIAIESTEGVDWEARFSTLVALDVLEHINDDLAALKQWASWLVPGGAVLLSVPAHSRRWGSGDVWAGHFRRYDREPLVAAVRASGLDVAHVECYGFPFANFTEWLGERHYRKVLEARAEQGTSAREHGNSQSGIERTAYQRAYAAMSSPFGRGLIRIGLFLQRSTLGRDWGSGYIVVARKA